MEFESRILSRFVYTTGEWKLVKILTGLLWLLTIARVTLVNKYAGQPFPEGICRLFNCAALIQTPIVYVLLLLAVLLVILYITERYMPVTLTGLALISIIVLTVERSHGISSRDELWSLLFIAQAIAYIRYSFTNTNFKQQIAVQNLAMFYSIQLIAAVYVTSGLTKLQTSGIQWIMDGPNIAAALYKINAQMHIEFGLSQTHSYLNSVMRFINNYPNITRTFFTLAILTELFALTMLLSRKWARKYGFLLLGLHIGIFVCTVIFIPVFIFCVVVYLIGLPKRLTSKL